MDVKVPHADEVFIGGSWVEPTSTDRRLQVGSFTMNTTGGVLGQPFGGYKRSGIGREMGLEGFLEWTQTMSVQLSADNYLA